MPTSTLAGTSYSGPLRGQWLRALGDRHRLRGREQTKEPIDQLAIADETLVKAC